MTKEQILKRQKAVAAAIGSVRAEGLQPPKSTQKYLKAYARGEISIKEVRNATISDIKAKRS